MLISEISKIPGETTNIQPMMPVNATPAVLIKRDELNPYTFVAIDSTHKSKQIYKVCHEEGNLCCHFELKLTPFTEVVENAVK